MFKPKKLHRTTVMSSNLSTVSGSVNGDDSSVNDDANKNFKPVTICKHGGPPSKDCPPEAKATVVVDCVVGLQGHHQLSRAISH